MHKLASMWKFIIRIREEEQQEKLWGKLAWMWIYVIGGGTVLGFVLFINFLLQGGCAQHESPSQKEAFEETMRAREQAQTEREREEWAQVHLFLQYCKEHPNSNQCR